MAAGIQLFQQAAEGSRGVTGMKVPDGHGRPFPGLPVDRFHAGQVLAVSGRPGAPYAVEFGVGAGDRVPAVASRSAMFHVVHAYVPVPMGELAEAGLDGVRLSTSDGLERPRAGTGPGKLCHYGLERAQGKSTYFLDHVATVPRGFREEGSIPG